MKRTLGIILVLLLFTGVFIFADGNVTYDSMMNKVVLLFNRRGGSQIESWIGSGVIISPDGYIVTNRHVAGYYVREGDEDEYGEKTYFLAGLGADLIAYHQDWGYGGARIVAVSIDPELDLALLKIEPIEEKLPFAELVPDNNIGPGLEVYAVGHPLGIGWLITKGIVSKVITTQRHNKILVHDASINPGSSGGPLFDEYGKI